MKELAHVNGVVTEIDDAYISINDRGLQFGDGVYEVARSYDGRLWALERHFERFERSLKEIWLDHVSMDYVRKAVVETYAASRIPNALVYWQATRGVSERDYAFDDKTKPTLIVTARHMYTLNPTHRTDGVSVVTHSEIRWARVDIKSLNLLGNMIAKRAARDAGAFEAVFVKDGVMTEGASTSLFIIRDGELVTREEGHHILPGVTRAVVIECANELGLNVRLEPYTLDDLLAADEAMLTGTTFGVYSIVNVDGKAIGTGKPGRLVRRLDQRYHERVHEGRE
ncbi:MAG: aminotransferase class IV [Candidatus Poribacteria bacterium]|nr:aminotransferase class IV [Candidatus Poribacteria bacterium]